MDDGTLSHTYLFTFIMYDYNTKYHPFAFSRHICVCVCVCDFILFIVFNSTIKRNANNKEES